MSDIITIFDLAMMHESSIQLLGIFFDIVGAFYLSRAFIFKSPEDIKSETYGSKSSKFLCSFGMSGNLFFSFYTQGIEARIGFIWLLLGFLFQGIGVIWSSIIIPIYLVLQIFINCAIISEVICHRLVDFNRVKAIHNSDRIKH